MREENNTVEKGKKKKKKNVVINEQENIVRHLCNLYVNTVNIGKK